MIKYISFTAALCIISQISQAQMARDTLHRIHTYDSWGVMTSINDIVMRERDTVALIKQGIIDGYKVRESHATGYAIDSTTKNYNYNEIIGEWTDIELLDKDKKAIRKIEMNIKQR